MVSAFIHRHWEIKTLTYTDEQKLYASLIYNEDKKEITLQFSGFNTDVEAKSMCYLLMDQFGIKNMNEELNIVGTIH